MVCPSLSRFEEAPVILRWLGRTASTMEVFEINASPEGQGRDLSRFGEARVILRWLGRTASPMELFEINGRARM